MIDVTKNELFVLLNAITNAQTVIQHLGTENYPYTSFDDPDFKEMFYMLNDMCIKLHQKIRE